MHFFRFSLMICLALIAFGCQNDNPVGSSIVNGLPQKFHFLANAEGSDNDGRQASCRLDLVFEIQNEILRVPNFVAYKGSHGGEVFRTVLNPNGVGFEFSAIVFGEVNFTLAPEGGIVHLNIPVNSTANGRFWQALANFEGTVDAAGHGTGTWTCAPLDINQGNYKDLSLTVQGLWSFDPV